MSKKAADQKDIFISYKNDGTGNNFAARLCADLVERGYTVYYNPNEQHAGSFPERLRTAVSQCSDFLLILTAECLEQLRCHHKVDWVREELLLAHSLHKNIIPLLMPKVSMPQDKDDMPEDLRFLPDCDAITMPDSYKTSPFACLLGWVKAKPAKNGEFRDVYNSSETRRIEQDIDAALAKADNRDPKAMYELATLYYYGLQGGQEGCVRDFTKVAQLLTALTETDSEYAGYAHSLLAELHYHGVMPRNPQSYAAALEHHQKAKSTSGFSARETAYLKSRGCGCDFDYTETVAAYEEAIQSGDSVAIIGLAKFYMSYGHFKEAAELYRRTSHILPEAEYNLGMLYRSGVLENPPKSDFFKAAFYFQHAISSGKCSSDAYHQLGRLYFTPTGDFPRDFAEAERNFLIAADMGNKDAQYKLGLMYEYGYVKQDIEKAIHFHSLAAAQGASFANYHLALLYANPGVKNYQEAYKNAEIAAKKRVMEGEYLLGVYLYYGRGCVANEDRAYKYFKRAYEHGMNVAKIYIDRIEGVVEQ